MKVLIDTNIFSLAMRGDHSVVKHLRMIEVIGFSVINIGELYAGFRGGDHEEKNLRELAEFMDSDRVVVHSIDTETSVFYAEILNKLKQAGTPIPTNDIWIAATVFQHGYRLFTRDRHFDTIPGLMKYVAL